ncbi:MAG: pilus assembly protein TadG-related protein [Candidatus Limnocylindrales bacterium]
MPHLGPRLGSRLGAAPAAGDARVRQRGQVLAIFAVSTFVFVAVLAIVVDVSWYWASSLKVQRAADAAALAGVVWLPGNVSQGVTTAKAEAAKNGYTDLVGGVTVTPTQDGSNDRQMDVTVSAPVNTFFMRLFGINSITATRSSKAEYVLPVPMGSPLNYFGDFGLVRHPNGYYTKTTTTTGPVNGNTSANAGTAMGTGWTNPTRADAANDNSRATSGSTSGTAQAWNTFNLQTGTGAIPNDATLVIDEIQVQIRALITSGTGTPTNCQIATDLSWNNGASGSWSSVLNTTLTTTETLYNVGMSASWGPHTWAYPNFSNASFRVRLTYVTGSGCSGGWQAAVDTLQVQVFYHTIQTTTTSTNIPDSNLTDPYANALAPQGFWGTIIGQGAISLNGDIYAPYYDTRTNRSNSSYSTNYYNYDVEMPAGSSNGELWIYDPVFCAGGGAQYGTGDRWFSGSTGLSTFYDLYDSRLTTDTGDDALVWSSGNTFKESGTFSDADMNGSGGTSCSRDDTVTANQGAPGPDGFGTTCNASLTSGIDCHLRWYKLPVSLAGGKIYRLHVSTTDPNNASAQLNADGHNSYALWASASGGTPRVYGVGAMETFEPLPGGGASIFYLAQIDAVHAGKTMEVRLWDPGDTSPLPASLKILQPTVSGYSATNFSWRAQKVNSGGQACTGSGTNVGFVTTNVGSTTGTFNGCWLIITIPLPTGYTAPTPPGETHGGGWWKIEYDMGGSSSSSAVDLTTWQVDLLGNPVHLVVP